MVYGLEGLYRFRRLKAGLHKVQANAGLVVDAYPWIRRAAVAGVVVFVLFPVAGTGAIGGCFLGILLGIRRGVLIAAVSAPALLERRSRRGDALEASISGFLVEMPG